MYEYRNEIWRAKCRESDKCLKEFVGWLNERGSDGWEVIETNEARDGSSVWVLFKRFVGTVGEKP